MIGQSRDPGTGAVGSIGTGLSGGTPDDPMTRNGLDGNRPPNEVPEEILVRALLRGLTLPPAPGCLSTKVSDETLKTKRI